MIALIDQCDESADIIVLPEYSDVPTDQKGKEGFYTCAGKYNEKILQKAKETAIAAADQVMFISHGDCIEDAEYLAGRLKSELSVKDVIISYVGPVIGAHSGPGTLALFYLGTQR